MIFRKYIKCKKCKCLLEKGDAKSIEVLVMLKCWKEYYCKRCAPNYDEISYLPCLIKPLRYYKKVEVNEDGSIVKE
jgi:hypothetical protein